MDRLKVSRELASRYLNDGFSGGEKKRVEILQMAMLRPRIAVLDETDSGLDIDALRVVASGVNELVGPEMGALVITHYQRILDYMKPDHVHVFVDGRIVESGGAGARQEARGRGLRALRSRGGDRGVMAQTETDVVKGIRSEYKYGFSNPDEAKDYFFKSGRGLSHELVEAIAEHKNEPDWMRKFRHKSLDYFLARPLPQWGGNLNDIDFENIFYYIKPTENQAKSWEDLPADIKDTWDKLGIPEAEKKYLAGVGAQYESEVVYHKLQEDLEKKGVIFLDTDTALREHEDLFKQYFGTIIPQNDNKFAALNSAVWSGGSFIYVPPGVSIEMPLQAYFRINAENMGQFERTLIIVDEGAYVHYVEGCTAPIYSTDSLHSAVVEIVVKKGGRCRYTTIQNWSNNVYNLVTKRAVAYEDATMEWVDGNLGSKLTMKYPAIWLMGERAHGEVLSIAFAGNGQHQDAGGKCVHVAPNTTSVITSKSISKNGGRAGYRGLLEGGQERGRLEVEGGLRRADPRRGVALRHVPVHQDRRRRRRHRPRGDRLEDRRGAALLPHVARAHRGRGERDDRERLRRADHEGAAARVRRRDEPADPAPDGGLGRLSSISQVDFGRHSVEGLGAVAAVLRRDARSAAGRACEGRVLGRRHVLRDLDAGAMGRGVQAAGEAIVLLQRGRRPSGAGRARGEGRRVRRRDRRHECLSHGDVPRPGRQPVGAPQAVRAVHMNVERTDFVSVFTQDIQRAKAFYAGTLGLEIESEGESDMEFRCGQVTLDVFDPSSIGQEFRSHRRGSRWVPTSTRRAQSSR